MMPTLLDHKGNPIPRAERRRNDYPPAEVFVNCQVCGLAYTVGTETGRPLATANCKCQKYERKTVPQAGSWRAMLGGLPAWLGV